MTMTASPTDLAARKSTARERTIASLVHALRAAGCAALPATGTADLVGDAFADFGGFAREWADLTQDTYMADGGSYRLRRYGRFRLDCDTGALELKPHGPYRQDSSINHLNGGIDRHFDPLTDTFSAHPVLLELLRGLGEVYTAVEGCPTWEINLHPYRIVASHGQAGKPAPEGRHRDGVTFILTMMVDRHGVLGGESSVHSEDGTTLLRHTLTAPGEILLGDDRATLHSVTPVTPAGADDGRRDVLVIAFTSMTALGSGTPPTGGLT